MSRPQGRIKKPRCFLVYALAPEGMTASDANRTFNAFVADQGMPLVLFHDHFIGHPGGLAVFFAESEQEREALYDQRHLQGWRVEVHPLIFAHSPAAFDEQISFTLRAYRGQNWERLRRIKRPSYGQPALEAETASEDLEDI